MRGKCTAIETLALATFFYLIAEPSGHAAGNSTPNSYAADAGAILAAYNRASLISGTVLVAKDGKILFQHPYGLANHEWNVRNTLDTKFRIGSVGKQFTAVAILQLVEQGKVQLDDPISKYYTDAPASWAKITIQHLLTHTSGIPDYAGLPNNDIEKRNRHTPESLIALIRDKPLNFEPGAQFAYSNSGYALLGYTLEKVSGLSYCDYMQRNVLGPLGLHNTGCETTSQIVPRFASGYDWENRKLQRADFIDPTTTYAAGQFYSTAEDLLKWEQSLVAGRVVNAASLKLAQTDYGHDYGFGFYIGHNFGHDEISHSGGVDGFQSRLNTYPQAGLVVIYLSNYDDGPAAGVADDLTALYFQNDGGRSPQTLLASANQFADRMLHPAPAPGSEAALRGLIAGYQKAPPDSYGPQRDIIPLGALQSITFKSVADDGGDFYDVQFANGRLEWQIRMNNGKVGASGFRKLP